LKALIDYFTNHCSKLLYTEVLEAILGTKAHLSFTNPQYYLCSYFLLL